jgi:hypothetical protein
MFAETCVSMGIETWRAKKLTSDFYRENNPSHVFGDKMIHDEWAKLLNIKKGSLIIFVGDGCLGSCENKYKDIWEKKHLRQFVDNYNPVWIHYYDKSKNCGCAPKAATMAAGFDAYYGIKKVNDLIPLI